MNRVFDATLLYRCSFTSTQLQLDTILCNLGLQVADCHDVVFRDARPHESPTFYSLEQTKSLLLTGDETGFAAVSTQYFRWGVSENFYAALFELTLDWSWLARRGSYSNVYYVEPVVRFLFRLYDDNKIIFLPLLRFLDFFNALLPYVEARNDPRAYRIKQVLDAQRHELSRYCQDFFDFMIDLEQSLDRPCTITFEAIGPLDRSYFGNLFENVVPDLEVREVRERNSPLAVVLDAITSGAGVSTLLLFYVIQVKFQISGVKSLGDLLGYDVTGTSTNDTGTKDTGTNETKTQTTAPTGVPRKSSPRLPSHEINIGSLPKGDSDVGLMIASRFKNGVCLHFHLAISAHKAIQLSRIIKSIIDLFLK